MSVVDTLGTLSRMGAAFVDRRIQYLILFVTARCNLLCKHCFYTEEILNWKSKKELTLGEYQEIASKAGEVIQVSLTGGEPFIRKDLADIILAFHERAHTLFFNVTTNGLLRNQILSTLDSLFSRAPDLALRLGLSIDGFEEVHDITRDKKGGFRETMETVKALAPLRKRFPRFTTHISTTLTRQNAATITELIDYVRNEVDVDAHYLGYIRGNAMDPNTKGVSLDDYWKATAHLKRNWIVKNPYQNVLNGMNALMNSVNRYILEEDRFFIPCVGGEKMLTLDEEGKVKPCEILEQVGVRPYMGDLRKFNYDLYALLESPEARRMRRWILDTKCHCTFECANQANVAYNPASFVKAAGLYLQQRLTPRNGRPAAD